MLFWSLAFLYASCIWSVVGVGSKFPPLWSTRRTWAGLSQEDTNWATVSQNFTVLFITCRNPVHMCLNQSRVLDKCLIKQGHGIGQVAQWTQQRSIQEIKLSCFTRALIQCWLKRSLRNLVSAFSSLVLLFVLYFCEDSLNVLCIVCPDLLCLCVKVERRNYNLTTLFSKYWQTFAYGIFDVKQEKRTTSINCWIMLWLLQIVMLHQSQCRTPCPQHHTLFLSWYGFICVWEL